MCNCLQRVDLEAATSTWLSVTAKGIKLDQLIDFVSSLPDDVEPLEPVCPEVIQCLFVSIRILYVISTLFCNFDSSLRNFLYWLLFCTRLPYLLYRHPVILMNKMLN